MYCLIIILLIISLWFQQETTQLRDQLKGAQLVASVEVQCQLADSAQGLLLEVTALRAKIAEMRQLSLTHEQDVRARVKEEYDDLVHNLFNVCLDLKRRFDEYRWVKIVFFSIYHFVVTEQFQLHSPRGSYVGMYLYGQRFCVCGFVFQYFSFCFCLSDSLSLSLSLSPCFSLYNVSTDIMRHTHTVRILNFKTYPSYLPWFFTGRQDLQDDVLAKIQATRREAMESMGAMRNPRGLGVGAHSPSSTSRTSHPSSSREGGGGKKNYI